MGTEKEDKGQEVEYSHIRRIKAKVDSRPASTDPQSRPVTAGTIDRVVDLAFNPTREKIREMTVIDRIQGRLLPQLDIIDLVWQYIIEVAIYRQNNVEYKRLYERDEPVPPSLLGEFTYRTAQWQKSIQGMNLKSGIDMALAEIETRGDEGGEGLGADAWKD